jgi:hypothetical protein
MYGGYLRVLEQHLLYMLIGKLVRNSIQNQLDTFLQKRPCREKNHKSNNKTNDRVYYIPACKGDYSSRDNNSKGN